MADLDDWLEHAARLTSGRAAGTAHGRIDRAIATGPSPYRLARRRDQRRSVLCAGLAALGGFGGSGTIATAALARPAVTWLSPPPAASPYGLLVGE